ncbi:hypothetical protein COT48_00995 [Candidatus Woesearchaeota archaeon CG08_land_8_20_14_0_20_47_9]|nr:MAG: hypothetical protein COT48_00995 [Candidatus Woesearchaeota archaeon CG08_land_8_20_14_0_20_47_9]
MISNPELIMRLVAAAVLGSFIGMEREWHRRPAGLRTHMLVCVSSALITMLSMYAFNQSDPARIAAQIITGIGFIGAGTIFRHKDTVTGITTAATLFVVAAIGIGIGSGFYLATGVGTVLMLATLGLRFLEPKGESRDGPDKKKSKEKGRR